MSDDHGWAGYLTFAAWFLLLWVLNFGVTWDGKHYSIALTCEKGLEIK